MEEKPGADYWRVEFIVDSPDISILAEALEDEAAAVSFFETATDENEDPTSWCIELLFDHHPDEDATRQRLAHVLAENGYDEPTFSFTVVDHTGWLGSLEKPQDPHRIGCFYIHGTSSKEAPLANTIPIAMDAGMAFGSGEHATTQACLLALDWLSRRHRVRHALDVGCGSGLLAIAAAKLWRCRVLASDIDPIAVQVARKNLRINDVALRVRAIEADGYSEGSIRRMAPFDLIMANILADPLIDMANELKRNLSKSGRAVLSGLLARQADAVVAAHRARGLHLIRRFDLDPWVALVFAPRTVWRGKASSQGGN